jgi:hypothetical protein
MPRPNNSDEIDDKILSKIPGLEDDTVDEADEQDAEDTGVEKEPEEEDADASDDESSGEAGDDESSASTGEQQQQQAPQQQFADPNKPVGQLGVDKRGNLINQQGQIVARAGSERRLFEKAQRFETQLNAQRKLNEKTTNDLQRAVTEIKGMREVIGLGESMRMTTQEAMLGLRMVDMYKKDPGEFFKYVLTQVTAAGHDVAKLLPEAGAAAVSAEGIQRLIQRELQQALGPVKDTRAEQQRQQQVNADVEKEYNEFIDRFPDAVTHEETIARLIQAEPNLSLDAAYYRLQAFAAKNGLDFSLPLKAQIEARGRSGTQNNVPRQQQQPQRQQRPMPGGRGAAPVVNNQPKFGADASFDDIIKSSLREHGIAS